MVSRGEAATCWLLPACLSNRFSAKHPLTNAVYELVDEHQQKKNHSCMVLKMFTKACIKCSLFHSVYSLSVLVYLCKVSLSVLKDGVFFVFLSK